MLYFTFHLPGSSNLMLMEHYFNIKYDQPQTVSCNDRKMKMNIFYYHQSNIRHNDNDIWIICYIIELCQLI